jgi:hypothetical protein
MAGKAIVVRFIGDEKDLKRAFGEAEAAGGKFAGAAKKIGLAAAAGLALAGAAAVKVGVDMTKLGFQLDSQERKIRTVFGEGLKDVSKWAEGTANAMGLSRRELLNLAAATQDLLVPMGFQRDRATEITKELTGLSHALSLWSGGQKSASDVSAILTKALLGERDELKSLGISISEADVQGQLLKNGKDKLTGAALEQAKAEATLELVMAKSTDAQTSAKNGANELYEAKLRLTGAFKDFRDSVALAMVKDILPGLADGFFGAGERGKGLADGLGDMSKWVEDHGDEIRAWAEDLGASLRKVADALVSIGKEAAKAAKPFKDIWSGDIFPGPKGILPEWLGGAKDKPGKAVGGPVSGGVSFLVGEQGPEIFTPSTSGTITPNGRMAAGGGPVVNVYVGGSLLGSLADVTEAVRRGLTNTGRLDVSALGGRA